MKNEFITFTPFNSLDEFAGKRNDIFSHVFRRPLLEYVERYEWLREELLCGHLQFPILEIGPGSGWGMKRIQETFPDEIIVGLDLDSEALHEGVSHRVHSLTQGNAIHEFPFQNSTFNTVVCYMVLEQLEPDGVRSFLSNLHRIVKSNARFVVAAFNHELFSPNEHQWFTPNKQEFTKNELSNLFEETGWHIEASYGQRFVKPEKFKKRALLFQQIQHAVLKLPYTQQIRFFQIMTPRLLNIVPSIIPNTTVEPIAEQTPREPVVDIIVSNNGV